jgi:NitT/TauT family transport system substrate-binding protein
MNINAQTQIFQNVKFSSLIFIIFLALTACSEQPNVPLRMGTNVWPGYEPLYLARELGYFSEDTVKLVEYPSASEVIRAFRNNTIEAAALTMDEVLLLAQDNLHPKVIVIADISEGADAILSKPEIKKFSDLKGKRIGVERSALGAYVLNRALTIHGLGESEIKVVDVEVNEHEKAYLQNMVDAVVTFEPVRSKLLQAGATLLFDSREIPGEIIDVLVVKEENLKKFSKEINNLLTGWFSALKYMKANPHDAAEKMAIRQGISTEVFLASLNGLHIPDFEENLKIISGKSPSLLKTASQLQTVMVAHRLLKRTVKVETLLEPQLFNELKIK